MKLKYILAIVVLSVGVLRAQGDLIISGFVDGSTALPTEPDVTLGFSFDGLEIDLMKEIAPDVSLRADIDFFEGGADVEQAFITFKPLKINGMATPIITFGKFNAPIGYELLDAPDMWQFSHSLVFDNALPTNLSGVLVSQALAQGFDVVAYLANGWDVNEADNDTLIFGARVGFSGIEGLSLGLSMIQNDELTMITDIDGEFTMVPNLTIGFEYNTGGAESGWLVMANYSFGNIAVTVRQDAWGDMSSTTISPSMGIADGAGVLFEYRLDNDGAGGSTSATAIEFTYSF